MPWFGGYVGNWFNGYVGGGRAMAELRWAYGKEQDMGIEALEAMLMDDKFREIHSSESGLNTCNHRFKISISPQVRLAGCSSWCCVFSVPRSLVMETNAAGGLHCHPRSKLWMQLLLWKWIKEVYFGSKKLSEKSRPKTMRPDRDFGRSMQNIVYYTVYT
ncbi:hypothetical protein Peur_071886 [Populus x canadensis]